jgi:rhodanese-related sulfurtransferase/biotin operon repressor
MSLESLPDELYEVFARIGKALSSPQRLQVINLLCQGEHSVAELAEKTGMSPANTSAHLQKLEQADLVEKRKEGRRVYRRLTSESVVRLWLSLRDLGMSEIPKARQAMEAYANEPAADPDLSGEALLEKLEADEVVLLDLRPEEEFEAGHLPKARSIPFAELASRMDEIPDDKEVVAYCRGPYCVAAIKGVQQLRDAGVEARRMMDGVAEWRAEGLPLETKEAE